MTFNIDLGIFNFFKVEVVQELPKRIVNAFELMKNITLRIIASERLKHLKLMRFHCQKKFNLKCLKKSNGSSLADKSKKKDFLEYKKALENENYYLSEEYRIILVSKKKETATVYFIMSMKSI